MEALSMGDPWDLATDVGPVIDDAAQGDIAAYLKIARADGLILKELNTPEVGHFIAPTVIAVNGILDLEREIFGPVLHLATFKADQIDGVLDDIAHSGYGLTFGLHTRIDDRVQHIVERLPVGNIYVNRNQIGAIVGSQPFGGEGLSGTGPKAGGPDYLTRFSSPNRVRFPGGQTVPVAAAEAQSRIDAAVRPATAMAAPRNVTILPGPTGESNRLSRYARAPLLCLGPGAEAANIQARAVEGLGGVAVALPETVAPETLSTLTGFSGAVWWGDDAAARALVRALSRRDGAILPLITGVIEAPDVMLERHVCVDTTASGGNAELLAEVSAG